MNDSTLARVLGAAMIVGGAVIAIISAVGISSASPEVTVTFVVNSLVGGTILTFIGGDR